MSFYKKLVTAHNETNDCDSEYCEKSFVIWDIFDIDDWWDDVGAGTQPKTSQSFNPKRWEDYLSGGEAGYHLSDFLVGTKGGIPRDE